MTDLPSGTVTFLVTDLEGSTRLWQEYPEAMRPALARHDEIPRDAIGAYGGHVVRPPATASTRCSRPWGRRRPPQCCTEYGSRVRSRVWGHRTTRTGSTGNEPSNECGPSSATSYDDGLDYALAELDRLLADVEGG